MLNVVQRSEPTPAKIESTIGHTLAGPMLCCMRFSATVSQRELASPSVLKVLAGSISASRAYPCNCRPADPTLPATQPGCYPATEGPKADGRQSIQNFEPIALAAWGIFSLHHSYAVYHETVALKHPRIHIFPINLPQRVQNFPLRRHRAHRLQRGRHQVGVVAGGVF